MNFYNEQLYEAAIDHFEFAINYDPNDYIFYQNLAMANNMQIQTMRRQLLILIKVIYNLSLGTERRNI